MKKIKIMTGLLVFFLACMSEAAYSQESKVSGEVEIGEGSDHNFYGAGFMNYNFSKQKNSLACGVGFDLERVGPRQASFTCGPYRNTEKLKASAQIGFSSQKEMAFFGVAKTEIGEREVEYFGDGRWKPEKWWLRQRLTIQAFRQVFVRVEGLANSHEEERFLRFGPEVRKKIKHGYFYGWGYFQPKREKGSLGYGLALGFRF